MKVFHHFSLANKIVCGIGAAYIVFTIPVIILLLVLDLPVFALIPGAVLIAGLFMTIIPYNLAKKRYNILAHGKKYKAKIHSYVENTSFILNGQYTYNVKVHYFDENGIEREVVIPTSFPKGTNAYPIGMTIDIFELEGRFGFDKKSVRNEILPGEAELMDALPIDPTKITQIGITCPNCSASFKAATGFSNHCPYCGSAINA